MLSHHHVASGCTAPSHDRLGQSALSPEHLRTLCALLDGQLWYWGQDIHHATGNALLAYGFDQARGPADGSHRSTAYTLPSTRTVPSAASRHLHGLASLTAWGFGVAATHAHYTDGSLLLIRHDRAPGLCAAAVNAAASRREQLPARRVPDTPAQWRCLRVTLTALARCLEDYERWARRTLGDDHRTAAMKRRPRAVRRRHPQPAFLAEAWRTLALDLAWPDDTPHVSSVRRLSAP